MTTCLLVALALLAVPATAQPPPRPCNTICPQNPPYKNVTITTDASFRYVTTSQCPPYENPKWSNPGHACERTVTYKIPLTPTYATTNSTIPVGEALRRYDNILYLKEDPAPILGVLGVLTSGVNIFGVGSPCGYSSKCPDQDSNAPSIFVDAVESEGHTTDQCGGHPAPSSQYHVHSGLGFNSSSGRAGCVLPTDTPGQHSQLLGWLFDGFGIYGQFSENGKPPTDLDKCGGHTHMINGESVYHYHFPYPTQFPWTIGCFSACPEVSNNQHEFAGMTKYGCPSD